MVPPVKMHTAAWRSGYPADSSDFAGARLQLPQPLYSSGAGRIAARGPRPARIRTGDLAPNPVPDLVGANLGWHPLYIVKARPGAHHCDLGRHSRGRVTPRPGAQLGGPRMAPHIW